ncbi:hypothetical protein J9B83_07805 [Marinomonas sp. A79]|uniref:DUF7482 domain-containing protein n=1 Tax=Marinomonas vulgaris TaxID=2823372 RepID=A0ABS5HB15_9GAMM|nr:hypothetical protein [Marinomonas vulgaris]MBR7888848.1 hypothetical protein [Marinomonas vulgaris]
MIKQSVCWCVMALLLSACAAPLTKHVQGDEVAIHFPLYHAWYNDQEILYITTDVSDQAIAIEKKANYAPRLRDALPRYPRSPGVKSALERVYAFPNQEQAWNVFPSAPQPLGPSSEDKQYSPLWLMYTVVWKDPSKARELRSEEAIFVAEDEGLVTVERTDVVLNCPVLPFSLKEPHLLFDR